MISNPADRKKIKDALVEISNSLTRIDAERDLIKDIVDDVADNFEVPKKFVNKMAKLYHKQTFQTEQAEYEEFEELYMNIMEANS